LTRIYRAKAVTCLLFFGMVFLFGGALWAADEEPNAALIQMIADLVGEKDRDMRALGLQQVREEVPGAAATKKFAALLPKLPPEGQAGLLEALADRGDTAALSAVLIALKSQEQAVRAAALRALGPLGSASEVPLLAGKVVADLAPERDAAKASLVRLRGEGVNAAILAAMTKGKPGVRAELLGVLAARNAKETLPKVLQSARDAEPSVRLAALGALRYLADENNTAAIVKLLKAAQADAERRKAKLTLLTVCSRGREKCADAIIAGMSDAGVPARITLLDGLARCGGSKSLSTVVARLRDEDLAVRDQAVRMLAIWSDPAVSPHLLALAKTKGSLRHQVLAIRGLVRLASPRKDKPADLKMLAEAMNLAKRPQEKRLVLGVLGGVATPPSLALVAPALDDPELVQEAALAAVMIAEKMEGGNKGEMRAVIQNVLKRAKRQQVRDRAKKILGMASGGR